MAVMHPTSVADTARDISLGQGFGKALCEHFGVNPGVALGVKVNCDRDEVLHAVVLISLTAEDLAAIAARMKHGSGWGG